MINDQAVVATLRSQRIELPSPAFGPATAIGHALIRAWTRGLIAGDLETLRALVRATRDIRRYEPRAGRAARTPASLGRPTA